MSVLRHPSCITINGFVHQHKNSSMHQGEFLKKIRLLKGLNQSGVATMLGITQQAYSKMETHASIDEIKFMDIIKKIRCTEMKLEIVKNYSKDEKRELLLLQPLPLPHSRSIKCRPAGATIISPRRGYHHFAPLGLPKCRPVGATKVAPRWGFGS